MKRFVVTALLASASWIVAGCGAEEDCTGRTCLQRGNGAGDDKTTTSDGVPPDGTSCSDAAKDRIGLGGRSLKIGRADGIAGADRRRSKPFVVLPTELGRVLGNTPASAANLGAAFGEAPPRWFSSPKPSAVAISSMFDVAFEGCLELTKTDAAYEAAPEESTATATCSAMARKFWSRVAAPADVRGCVDVAVTDSVNETYATGADGAPMTQPTTPRRRWAYACASLLTTTQFLAY
jgi:hypothetical protein